MTLHTILLNYIIYVIIYIYIHIYFWILLTCVLLNYIQISRAIISL